MSNNIYTAGLSNVGSYQVSGIPFCSGNIDVSAAGESGYRLEFPYVASWVMVINDKYQTGDYDAHIVNLGFSSLGVQGTNHISVYNTDAAGRGMHRTRVLDLKVTEIWLSGSSDAVSVVAGLTNIPVQRVTNASPSGSNWSGSSGVG